MTQLGNERIVGVDVSKDRLDLYDWDSKCPDSIANDIDAIDRWLDGFSLPVRFAIEPTNQFHIALAERAHARGHAVYLVDPHRLSHYRCGVGQRVKADPRTLNYWPDTWRVKETTWHPGSPCLRVSSVSGGS